MTKQIILRHFAYFVLSVVSYVIRNGTTLILPKHLHIGLLRL